MDSTRPIITSTHNPRFKEVLALREARERTRQGRILIDGLREMRRALDAGVRPVEAWVDPEWMAQPAVGTLVERMYSAGCAVVEADARLIGRLGYGERQTGLVLVAEAPTLSLQRLDLGVDALVVVLEGVEKPGNLGAVLRTADGVGAAALIVADGATDPFNPNVIRASVGTVFSVPLAVASVDDVLPWLREHKIRIFAARVDATIDHTDVDLTGSLVIALGSEVRGLSDAWSGPEVTAVRLPMHGVADSLNVSATAAVLLYEALRQRRAT